MDLTVVLAEAPGHFDIEPALASILRACTGLRIEVLVVGEQNSEFGALPMDAQIRRLPSAPGTLVPVRWGEGISAARAPVVACLSTEFSVAPTWAHTLLGRLDKEVIGAAGAVALAPGASAATTAMYLLRFAPFLPKHGQSPVDSHNIPGDGAMYLRNQILEHADLLAEGYWEVEFHRRWLARGKRLRFDRQPLVVYHGPAKLREGVMLRYRHGVAYGSTMVLRHGHSRMRHILAAPLLPVVLTARIIRRAAPVRGGLILVTRALLPLLVLTAAWSLGEAVGAARAGRSRQ